MVRIKCIKCDNILDIDTQQKQIKVTLYLMMCHSCQIETKNNERDIKLKKILKKSLIKSIFLSIFVPKQNKKDKQKKSIK